MRINHIAAYVHDLERTRAFYEDYFGASVSSQYHNPQTGLKTYFLSFGGDCRFEIMSRPNIGKNCDNAERMGYVHLAFCTGDKASVDQLTNRLRNDGYIVFSEPRTTGDGYYESCVSDPDGNRIEIVA
jgi:lactoylglutathione lyase